MLKAKRLSAGRRRTGCGRRAMGQKNDTAAEIDYLLEVVEKVEPIRSNMWASVWNEYSTWAKGNNYPLRNLIDLLTKVRRRVTHHALCSAKVKKDSPFYLGRVQAVSLGGALDSDDGSPNSDGDGGDAAANERPRIG